MILLGVLCGGPPSCPGPRTLPTSLIVQSLGLRVLICKTERSRFPCFLGLLRDEMRCDSVCGTAWHAEAALHTLAALFSFYLVAVYLRDEFLGGISGSVGYQDNAETPSRVVGWRVHMLTGPASGSAPCTTAPASPLSSLWAQAPALSLDHLAARMFHDCSCFPWQPQFRSASESFCSLLAFSSEALAHLQSCVSVACVVCGPVSPVNLGLGPGTIVILGCILLSGGGWGWMVGYGAESWACGHEMPAAAPQAVTVRVSSDIATACGWSIISGGEGTEAVRGSGTESFPSALVLRKALRGGGKG